MKIIGKLCALSTVLYAFSGAADAADVIRMTNAQVAGAFSANPNACVSISGNYTISANSSKQSGGGPTTSSGSTIFGVFSYSNSCTTSFALCFGFSDQNVQLSSNPPTTNQVPKSIVASGSLSLTDAFTGNSCDTLNIGVSANVAGNITQTTLMSHRIFPSSQNPAANVKVDEYLNANTADARGTVTVSSASYGGPLPVSTPPIFSLSNGTDHSVQIGH